MSVLPSKRRTNAICCPSGDQSGSKLRGMSAPLEQPQWSALACAPPADAATNAIAPRTQRLRLESMGLPPVVVRTRSETPLIAGQPASREVWVDGGLRK